MSQEPIMALEHGVRKMRKLLISSLFAAGILAATTIGGEGIAPGEWDANLLEDPIGPGHSRIVYMSDGLNWCRFHVKARFRDGDRARSHDFNACEQPSWTVRDNEEDDLF